MASLNSLLSGGVKSVQRGVMIPTFAANITLLTVAAVNPAKTVLITTGFSMGGSSSPPTAASMPRLELISATQIQMTRETGGVGVGSAATAWQLVEYY